MALVAASTALFAVHMLDGFEPSVGPTKHVDVLLLRLDAAGQLVWRRALTDVGPVDAVAARPYRSFYLVDRSTNHGFMDEVFDRHGVRRVW